MAKTLLPTSVLFGAAEDSVRFRFEFNSVAPYVQDAVKALITSGLVNGKSGRIVSTDYTPAQR